MKIPMYLVIFVVLVVAAAYLVFFKNAASTAKLYGDDSSPVMYFYSDTCSHCIAMIPTMNKLAGEGYRVKLMDVRANPSYWKEFGVSGTPTWIAPSGERLVGEQSESVMRDFLDRNGAKIAQPGASTV